MEERKPGSYIEDKKGNLTPNLADEAMKARDALEKQAAAQPAQPEEVKNAGK